MTSNKPTFENAKYKSTGETRPWYGGTLHQIRAVSDMPRIGVAAGDLGGWVGSESNLCASGDAWLHGGARVCGDARVYGDAQVYGSAWVHGDAQVYGDARVYGSARVYDNARVYGDAQVYGDAWLHGDARVCGDARVYGSAWVYGSARVYGDAQVCDNAQVYGDARVYDNARAYGGARVYGRTQVYGNAQVYGRARVYDNTLIHGNALVRGVNLTMKRSDGSTFSVCATPDGPRIIAGCRYFTYREANRHWRETRGGTQLGSESLLIVKSLKAMAKLNGFDEPLAASHRSVHKRVK